MFFHIFLVYETNKSRRSIKFLKFTSNIVDIMQALIGKAAQFLFFCPKGQKKLNTFFSEIDHKGDRDISIHIHTMIFHHQYLKVFCIFCIFNYLHKIYYNDLQVK